MLYKVDGRHKLLRYTRHNIGQIQQSSCGWQSTVSAVSLYHDVSACNSIKQIHIYKPCEKMLLLALEDIYEARSLRAVRQASFTLI
jgi:hypothetical protein